MADSKPTEDGSEEPSVTDTASEDPNTMSLPTSGKKTISQADAGAGKGPTIMTEKDVEGPKAVQPEDDEDNMDYPHGMKLWIILAALMLSVFLVALDQTIISTAIPKITDHFKSIQDIGWVCLTLLLPNYLPYYMANCPAVWLLLSSHIDSIPADLWQDIHYLQCRLSSAAAPLHS